VETVNKTISVHRFILEGRSEVLLKLLNEKKDEPKKFLEVKEYPTGTVEQMIQFLYGFEIPEKFKDFTNLYALAEKYALQDLKGIILKKLDNITRENFLQTAEMAELYNLDELTEKCATFCVREATIRPVWKKEPESGKLKLVYESSSTTSPPKEGLTDKYTLGTSQHTQHANSGVAATPYVRGAATVAANSKGGAAAPYLFGVQPSSELFSVTSSSKFTESGLFGAPSTPTSSSSINSGLFGAPSTPTSSSSIFGCNIPASASSLSTSFLGTAPATESDHDSKLESAGLPTFEPALGKLGFFKLEKGQLEKLPKLASAMAMKHFENLVT